MCGEVSEEVYFVEDILTGKHCKEQSCDGKCRSMRRTFRQTLREAVMLLWKDIKDMKWAVILITAYFALGWKYLYSLCPVVVITGFPCPGCGLTRAGVRMLWLDFAGAFEIQPFIYPIALFMGSFGWNRYLGKRKMGRYLKGFLIMIMTGMIIFYIWRMMNYFPGESPMNYYHNNLINRWVNALGR